MIRGTTTSAVRARQATRPVTCASRALGATTAGAGPSRNVNSKAIRAEDKLGRGQKIGSTELEFGSLTGQNLIPIRTNLKGSALLNTPALNKGAGFTRDERAIFGLDGFLPYDVHSLEKQALRAWNQLLKQPSVILKHAFLASLRDQNTVLFYKLMSDHLKELLGVLYTPGAAEAVSGYSSLFRRPIGTFISFPNQDGMRAQLKAHLSDINRTADIAYDQRKPDEAIDLIIVTDSESILGIGDQGVGGITISTSKAALYTLGAGINPSRVLSCVLDCGTDNHALFSDPLYMGWKRTRIRGKIYDKFVDNFITNCRELFPNAIIHMEDFSFANAYRFMEKYKDIPIFNDDVQGTGSVGLGALLAAIKVAGSTLRDQRIVVYGAGAAGMGISDQIREGLMILEGLTKEEACKRFWAVDRNGLLLESMGNALRHAQIAYARPDAEVAQWERENPDQAAIRLIDVIREVKPTVLIGTSTHARAFNEQIIREMKKYCDRPIIMPMSNPTALAEADPIDIMEWTDGQALIATGSPFPPVPMPDGKEYVVAQTNNAMVYPALGLGAILAKSRTISSSMIMASANALSELSPALKDPGASLLPDLADVRDVSVYVAAAVVRQAVAEGNAQDEYTIKVVKGEADQTLEDFIVSRQWDPVYRPLALVD